LIFTQTCRKTGDSHCSIVILSIHHDGGEFIWEHVLIREVGDLDGAPGNQCDDGDFDAEDLVDVGRLEVVLHEDDAHEVGDGGEDLDVEHLSRVVVDLRVHVQDLNADQGGEGDGHNVDIGVIEHYDRE